LEAVSRAYPREPGAAPRARPRRAGKALAYGLALACLGLAAVGLAVVVSGEGAGEVLRRLAVFTREAGPGRLALCLCVYCLAGAAAINCPFPLAGILKAGSGFLFGVPAAAVVNSVMTVCGAFIGFTAVRGVFGGRLAGRLGSRFQGLDAALAKDGFWYVLSCRLALVVPFSAVNAACGLSGMARKDFLWATFFGDLPVSILYAVAGAALSRWSLEGVAPSGRTAALLAVFAVAVLLWPLASRRFFGIGTPARRAQ